MDFIVEKDLNTTPSDGVNEKLIKDMLTAIGEDPTREGLVDTPKRVVKMWKEIFRGYDKSKQPKIATFTNGSDGLTYDEMIHDSGDFYSHCEHHMVPFSGKYWFGYIPNPKGKILGLSKVARVVDYYSAKLQIQERLVKEVVDCLWNSLADNTEFPPLAMGLTMEAEHLCKSMRGAKKKGNMRTSVLLGGMKDKLINRQEFFDYVNANR